MQQHILRAAAGCSAIRQGAPLFDALSQFLPGSRPCQSIINLSCWAASRL